VLRLFAGIDSVGIYQSGMRIFQGGAQAAPILANVFLPEMARKALEKNRDFRIAFIAQAAFVSYGIIFGLSLAYFPNQIVNLTFGKNYERLATLLPLFGFLFFIRFFASAWGVILIAEGFQEYRAKATAIHLVFVLILGSYLALSMQTKGWLVASILANLLLGVLLMLRVTRRGSRKSIMIGVCMLVLGGLLFVPILF
jgi:O-antigen/teichoic acid export membrane protein